MKEDIFQALSSPYRREIIKLLRWKSMSAGEIVEQFDIAQPSISRHLDVLKKAELVTSERRGNQIIYSLNMSAMEELLLYVTELLSPRADQEVSHECP